MSQQNWRQWTLWISFAIVCAITWPQFAKDGRDFEVFWKSARFLWSGEALYSVERDGPWVYKYPPWTILLFLPFAALPLSAAKAIWGAAQLFLLGIVSRILAKTLNAPVATGFALLLFGGLWVVNAQDGQSTLLILATLFILGIDNPWRSSPRSVLFLSALASKVFTFLPFVATPPKSFSNRKHFLISIGVCLLLTLPITWIQSGWNLQEFVREYFAAISSSGNLLEEAGTRGRYNQGFPGFIMRLFSVPASQTHWDALASVLFSATLGMYWFLVSRRLTSIARWSGWIALIPAIHPLPYFYSFAFAFPLAAVLLSKVQRALPRSALALLSVLMIAVVTEKTMGSLGSALEWISIKSWGVLLGLVSLQLLDDQSNALSNTR